MELFDRVRETIRRYDLAGPATRVVVALSGGSDSVALAHVLRALDAASELRVAGLAHFNHQLRPAAMDDEQYCLQLAGSFGLPIVIDREDVAGRARHQRRSLEEAARTARHEFFERTRRQLGADVVALGHTRDDQAETFLLRLLRGAGSRGLASMHPRRETIIRPLIDCRRADLRQFLDARHVAYRHDESNDDVSIPRNRVRAELLPFVERRFNPSIVDVLADEADIAREEWQWLEAESQALGARVCAAAGRDRRIDAEALSMASPALARLVVRRAMIEASGHGHVSFRSAEKVLSLCRQTGPPIDLPGVQVERVGAFVVLRNRPAGSARSSSQDSKSNLFCYPLSIPGAVELPEAGCLVSAEEAVSADRAGVTVETGGPTAVVSRAGCTGPFSVRNRRPGDRFRPLGLGGRKKLQDFFVDKKVSQRNRDTVPLIVDGQDRIVWVAGHTIDEEFRVTDPAQAVLILRLKVLGGPA